MRRYPASRVSRVSLAVLTLAAAACSKSSSSSAPIPALVAVVTPAPGLAGVSAGAPVTVTFTAPLDCATVSTSSFLLASGTGPVPGAVTCSGATATFTPSAGLAAETSYAATLTPAIRTADGAALAALFEWTFTTAATACGTNAPTVTASAMPNSVEPLAPVQLTATATDADDQCLGAPQPRTFLWTVASAPAASTAVVADPASPATTFTPDVPGTYQLEVVATDSTGLRSAPAFVDVTATTCSLLAPSVAAFLPVSAILDAPLTLPAPVYTDANCVASGGPVTYAWSVVDRPAGSAALLGDPGTAQPVLTPDRIGVYRLSVVVTNAAGIASQPALLDVDVSTCGAAQPVLPALVASPAPPNTGDVVSLGLASDVLDPNATTCGASGVLPYQYDWKMVAAPAGSGAVLTSATGPAPAFVPDVPGVYQIALTVTDALGNSSEPGFLSVATTTCGVNPPLVSLPASTGAYANTPVQIPATVYDADDGASCPARFATDVARVDWSIVAQPAGSHPSVSPAAAVQSNGATPPTFTAAVDFSGDVPGTYVVQAVATTSRGTVGPPSRTDVVVSFCGTHAPVVTGVTVVDPATGAPISRPAVGQPITVAAMVYDADATNGACDPALTTPTVSWTLASAPAGSGVAAPVGSGNAAVTFTPDVAGSYTWTAVAVDPQGLASAPFSVTVPTGACGPTIAATPAISSNGGGSSAGSTISLWLNGPVTSACVVGGASPTLAWSFTSRPVGSAAVIASPASATPSFVADVPGIYGVRLVATDSGGFASAFDTDVTAGGCIPPAIVNTASQPLPASAAYWVTDPELGTLTFTRPYAGSTVTLGLPAATPSSGGIVAGSCGGIASWEWSMLSRPPGSAAVLSFPTSATPSFVADVAGGTYELAAIVRDAQGNASSPFVFDVVTSGCGTYPPALPGALTVAPVARANAPFAVTAPAPVDGNALASCPARFLAKSYTYAFAVSPAGSVAGGGTSSAASVTVPSGGAYTVSVTATSDAGLTSTPLTSAVAVSACGTYPPVARWFAISQAVPGSGGGTATVGDTPATGATLTAGGAATSNVQYYADAPMVLTPSVTDADTDVTGVCAAFGLSSEPVTSAWSVLQAPAGSAAAGGAWSGSQLAFTPDLPGTYTVALTTTDSTGSASTSTVGFTVGCGASAPTVGAVAASQTVSGSTFTASTGLAMGYPVALSVAASDPDAVPSGFCPVAEAQPLAYRWSFAQRPPGSAAALLGADTATPSFVPDVTTVATGVSVPYVIAVTVTDPQGHAASSQLSVAVTCDPTPRVATDLWTGAPDFSVLQGVSPVNGGHVLGITAASNPTIAGEGLDGAVAHTGSNPSLYPRFPAQVSANVVRRGCEIFPITDPVTYRWSMYRTPAGSMAGFQDQGLASPSFTPDLAGSYAFQVVLSDTMGHTSTTVLDMANGVPVVGVNECGLNRPVARAAVVGPIPPPASGAVNEPLGLPTQLDASQSYDVDAVQWPQGCGLTRPLAYQWSVASAPPGSAASPVAPTGASTPVTLDLPGAYALQLSVTAGGQTATQTLEVSGVAGYESSEGPAAPLFTATALDASGNPVVATWDDNTGSVAVSQCTFGCDGPNPVWTQLGPQVDSGIGTMAFASYDEPRPVAVAVSGSSILVAYFTGTGSLPTLAGMPPCSVAVAEYPGFGNWLVRLMAQGNGCDAFGNGEEYGRWLAMAATSTAVSLVAYHHPASGAGTPVFFTGATGQIPPDFNGGTGYVPAPSGYLGAGRWPDVVLDPSGAGALVYRVDGGASGSGIAYVSVAPGPTFAYAPLLQVGDARFVHMASTGTNRAIVYYDAAAAPVATYASCTGVDPSGGCTLGTPQTIPDAATPSYGPGVAVAYDANGNPRVAYLDTWNSKIRVVAGTQAGTFAKTAEFYGSANPVGLSIASGARTAVVFDGSSATPGMQVYMGP